VNDDPDATVAEDGGDGGHAEGVEDGAVPALRWDHVVGDLDEDFAGGEGDG
jgi:hypothetical protein